MGWWLNASGGEMQTAITASAQKSPPPAEGGEKEIDIDHVLSPVRHLILPFGLKDDRGAFSNEENVKILGNLFPGTKGLVFGDFYLIFCVD
jgi:hypothetical protein